MAYMSQENKAKLAPGIKAVLKKYNLKGSISVDNHSSLVCTIKSGPLDFIGNMTALARTKPGSMYWNNPNQPVPTSMQVNPYWIGEHYTGHVKDCLLELKAAMDQGNHDRSDIQTDYFDVGWHININIGRWNQPYALTQG